VLIECTDERLAAALTEIAGDAWRRDGDPSFPTASLQALAAAGALGLGTQPAMTQWNAVRWVAAADPVVGRIFERHLEAAAQLDRHAPEPLRSDELDCAASGERVLGVWEAADLELRDGALHGEITGAVGAGGVERAVVLADQAFYVDVRENVEVDRSWRVVQGEPMSAGERVELRGAPVVATLWDDAAARSRAPLRRVAAHMGVVDAMAEAAMGALADLDPLEEAQALAAGRMAAARRTLDLWLAEAARQADETPDADLTSLAAQTRAALAVIAGSVRQEAELAPETAAVARANRELSRVPGIERPDTALASAGRELLRRRRNR
jgi:hypothetical protein